MKAKSSVQLPQFAKHTPKPSERHTLRYKFNENVLANETVILNYIQLERREIQLICNKTKNQRLQFEKALHTKHSTN